MMDTLHMGYGRTAHGLTLANVWTAVVTADAGAQTHHAGQRPGLLFCLPNSECGMECLQQGFG